MRNKYRINFLKKFIKFTAIFLSVELMLILFSNISFTGLLVRAYGYMIFAQKYDENSVNISIDSLYLFFFLSFFLAIFCYLLVLLARITRNNEHFNLPIRGEFLLIIWYFVMYSFNFALIDMLEAGDGGLLLKRDFWGPPVAVYGFAATLSWLMACGWLGMVNLVYIGGEKERKEIDSYLRNVTFMKNKKQD